MTPARRLTQRLRTITLIALAYALALQGLLGALGAGAHAAEARLASQLGVICTIHGVVDPATGQADGGDPSPGRLACVEHCLPLAAPARRPPRLHRPRMWSGAPPPMRRPTSRHPRGRPRRGPRRREARPSPESTRTSFFLSIQEDFIMIRLSFAAAISVAALALSSPAFAQHAHGAAQAQTPQPGPSVRVGALVIEAPWTRATPGGARVAGGYMRITNTGREPDRLTGGSFPLAGRFEVHEMATANGVMTMRELARGLEIGPGQTVELKPGGFHVMFMDLREPVREGRPIKGTLVFEKAGTVEIEYRVAPIGARGHAH